ncbi:hypothetical protein ETB97_005095 [Aspergillus alliaceus]|uniref:NADH:flavin oxidoreductase/NADH oxidase N-terminal domain-containing protein n=1 Tax=Petromyces alliaceus TaxID=209559 RepID=A0A8H6ADU4_PETAA|nr:hypothetical protein ETB97_005095 [Aspergillus burnettii]
MSSLGDAVKLPCGLVLPYLFVKAAMAERIAESGHNPTPLILDLYNQWGQDGNYPIDDVPNIDASGNVQVDVNHLGTPGDPALHDEYTGKENNEGLVATWAKYAQACQQHGTPGIVQICHPGRQLLRGAGTCGLFASTIITEQKSASTAVCEAFFIEFATENRKRYPNIFLMLTGGFRSRAGAEYAIKNACDLISISRPAAIDAKFPQLRP